MERTFGPEFDGAEGVAEDGNIGDEAKDLVSDAGAVE